MRAIFFGTPEFSASVLDYLISRQIQVVAVVSKPDRPKGRSLTLQPTPVKALIQSKYPEIPLFQPEKVSDPSFAPVLQAFDADIFIVVAFGEIIKQHLLDMPKKACINLHTSLLPKLRGAAPIQRAIMQGEVESGATIMHMTRKMDAGDIITQVKVPITPDMTFGELENAILEAGKKALADVLIHGEFPGLPQDETKATLAPKVELEECEVKWDRLANTLHNLIRGTNPEPGSWCWVHFKGEKKRLKIFKSRPLALQAPSGTLIEYGKTRWVIACQEGALELFEIQLEGKKRMPAAELMRGFSSEVWNFDPKL